MSRIESCAPAWRPRRIRPLRSIRAYPSRLNIYFNIISPAPGTFIIALHFKGRDKPILEMDLKIDDLLEKVGQSFRLTLPESAACGIVDKWG